MSASMPCPACATGDHATHVEHWDKAPDGVLGGAHCPCPGGCTAPDMSWLGVLPVRTPQVLLDAAQAYLSVALMHLSPSNPHAAPIVLDAPSSWPWRADEFVPDLDDPQPNIARAIALLAEASVVIA